MPAPNVLFLMSDQHNVKCAGFSGHELVQTPHLDQLASQGVRCTSAFTQNPICTPSRMCYLTSQYCHNHGYYGLKGPCPPQLPSLFHQFHEAGWYTGAIGKIHLPDNWVEAQVDFFAEWSKYTNTGLPLYRDWLAQRSDFTPHNEQHPDGRPDWIPKELDYDSGWSVEMTREFLNRRPDDQPFLLWLTLGRPHQEYCPAEEFWDLYPEDIPMPPTAGADPAQKLLPMRRSILNQRANPPAKYEPKDYESLQRRKLRGYYGNISQMDYTMGQAIAMVDALGERDNTIIVYCSDHGDFACEHGLLEKAPGISADAIGQIPMLWSMPGTIPQGEVRGQLVETLDVWPTVASLCGLDPLSMWDGKDLSEVLVSDTNGVRDAAFTELPFSKCITTQRWRLTWVPSDMHPGDPIQGELYDRVDDPWEQHNLYHHPGYQPVVRDLTARLMDWLVTSQHPVSAWPVMPHPTLTGNAERMGAAPYPEDGRTAPQQIRAAVAKGQANYL